MAHGDAHAAVDEGATNRWPPKIARQLVSSHQEVAASCGEDTNRKEDDMVTAEQLEKFRATLEAARIKEMARQYPLLPLHLCG